MIIKNKRFFLLGISALALSVANAAVYKQVDATGQVSYTDKPSATISQSKEAVVKQMPIRNTAPQVGGPQWVLPADLEDSPMKASAAIAGLYTSSQFIADFCRMNVSSTAEKVTAARKNWEATNSKVIKKSACILRENMPNGEYGRFLSMLDATGRDASLTLAHATPSEKLEVCENLPARYALPQINLMSRKKLVAMMANTPSKLCRD